MRRHRELIRERLSEPGGFWIRYVPRSWPGPSGKPWLDLATGMLPSDTWEGEPSPVAHEAFRRLEELPLDDVLYLPPVPPALAEARDRLACAHLERGTPVVAQCLPGDPSPANGCLAVLDLLAVALEPGGLGNPSPRTGLGSEASQQPSRVLPTAEAAAWPLLPGLGLALQHPGLAQALSGAGVRCLQGVALDLPSRQLRCLAEGLADEEAALGLFHGAPPSALEAAREALSHGFLPYLPRPLPRPPLRGAGNLRLAGALALAGELSLLRREPASRSQGFLRAARWAERCTHDLEAMVREGNLSLLHWLEEEPRRVLVAAAGRAPGSFLDELLAPGLPEVGTPGQAAAGGSAS